MELEELKKSWNALDEHLKDKEFIKEEELEKLIRHADKGIHAIARLNIKLILISLPILILFFSGGTVAQQIKPDLYHYHFRMDSCPLLGYRHHPFPPTDTNRRDAFGRSNQPRKPYPSMDHQGTIDCYCLSPSPGYTFIYLLASVAIWNGHDCFLHPVMGRRTGIDLMDLPQEVLKSYPRNQKEFKRTERINVKESNLNNSY